MKNLSEMDVSTGEYCKMDKWINGLIKIPFGKYQDIEITMKIQTTKRESFIQDIFYT